jgi:hypothetical protein
MLTRCFRAKYFWRTTRQAALVLWSALVEACTLYPPGHPTNHLTTQPPHALQRT